MSTYVNEAQLFDIDTRPCPEVDVRDLLIYAKDSTEENVVDLSTISDKGPFHGFGVVSFGGKTAVRVYLEEILEYCIEYCENEEPFVWIQTAYAYYRVIVNVLNF